MSEGFKDLKCDDSTVTANVRHMFRGGKDICLETFGEEDDECQKMNNIRISKTEVGGKTIYTAITAYKKDREWVEFGDTAEEARQKIIDKFGE